MHDSRQRILARLHAVQPQGTAPVPTYRPAPAWDRAEMIERFSTCMRAVRGEVHRVPSEDWLAWLNRELPARQLPRVLVGNGELGHKLHAGLSDALEVHHYNRSIETWKDRLFRDIDVAITGCQAAIAETGSLVLWPSTAEPRLMSLVPPVHIVVMEAGQLHASFADVIAAHGWAEAMPTNALLISGPSKTADIEQTLAYGIHGPRQLLTLILE